MPRLTTPVGKMLMRHRPAAAAVRPLSTLLADIRLDDEAPLRPKAASRSVLIEEISRRVRRGAEDPFYLVDLHAVHERVDLWHSLLPEVEPFYAVKCNPDPSMVALLASAGLGFDCASQAEMQQVLELGVDPARIVYANPCKQPSHLHFAADQGVSLTVFDCEQELDKMAHVHPEGELLLRIAVDDSKAQCVMSMKYGAPLHEAPRLLRRAAELGLRVRGVSFHVGSGCYSPDAYDEAVSGAAYVHELAAASGAPMDILDVGGGFPGSDSPQVAFADIASTLSHAIAKHFPRGRGVRVIAEPGRFIAATSHTLAVNIIGKKTVQGANGEPHIMYFMNDGLYGSFNNVVYDHATPLPLVLPQMHAGRFPSAAGEGETVSCSLWGPTCDGFDCVIRETRLPDIEAGRWLYFEDMGAYTAAAGSNFNGMPLPDKFLVPMPRH